MPGSHEAVTALLKEQHEHIKRLLHDVRSGSNRSREGAFFELRRYLAAHEVIEESVLHPALGDEEAVVEQRVSEERDATALVEELEQFEVDSEAFVTRLAELTTAVIEHAEAEERQELTMLLPRLSREETAMAMAGLSAVADIALSVTMGGSAGSTGFAAMLTAAREEIHRRGLVRQDG
jgi:hypothetical protein